VEPVQPGADFRGGVGRVWDRLKAGQLERLALVWRDEIKVAEGQLALRFGIEGDKLAGGPGEFRDLGDQLIGKDALGVVGENHGVGRADRFTQQNPGLGRGDGVVTLGRLAVEAAELLVLHQHAGLDDGGTGARRGEGGDALFLQDLGEFGPGLIRADETGHGAAGAERGEVEGDIGRPAGRPRIAGNVHHRHRGLGRNAGGITPDVVVEHHIADDEDVQPGDLPEQGGQAFHRISHS
jgi:hypothetical protein